MRAGQAKCLLVTSKERTPVLPDTTSLGELNIANTASELWRGIIGPKGMPADRVATLQKDFYQATQQPKFLEFETSRGESAVGGAPGDFAKVIRAEFEANAEILKRLGLAKKN